MDSHSLGRPVATVKGARSAGIAPVSVSHHTPSHRAASGPAASDAAPGPSVRPDHSPVTEDASGDASSSEPSRRALPASAPAGSRGEL
ncbi:hypothetical protein GCM10022377_00970 [Zhihengliuella alba]|uniref:Uncharacterized protein n=1 Tax=Zhihengliuella alba TaxID=547018 RepID=A0ABP7CP31_9MICC